MVHTRHSPFFCWLKTSTLITFVKKKKKVASIVKIIGFSQYINDFLKEKKYINDFLYIHSSKQITYNNLKKDHGGEETEIFNHHPATSPEQVWRPKRVYNRSCKTIICL